MNDPYASKLSELVDTSLSGTGRLDPAIRSAAADHHHDLPSDLSAYADKVAKRAFTVTDEDVERLKRAGYSEDQIFELTVSVAIGAALRRIEAGLGALQGNETCA